MEKNSHLLEAMQVFISVVDSGSFSESARRLGLSQPSISRQLNRLEDHLGVRLLQRTTRRLSVTEVGQVYYEKARQIQRSVFEAHQSIRGYRETPSGTLRISAPYTWTDAIITPYIGEFLQLYPEINLDIECNDSFQDIIEDRLDVVIRVGEPKTSSLIAVPFADIEMVACASPAYIKKYGTPKTPKDLQNHNSIVFEHYRQIQVTDASGIHAITLTGNISTNTVTVMQSAVHQSIGVTVLPDLLIHRLLDSGKLVNLLPSATIQLKDLPISKLFALYTNRKYLPAKVRVFLDFFRQRLKHAHDYRAKIR